MGEKDFRHRDSHEADLDAASQAGAHSEEAAAAKAKAGPGAG